MLNKSFFLGIFVGLIVFGGYMFYMSLSFNSAVRGSDLSNFPGGMAERESEQSADTIAGEAADVSDNGIGVTDESSEVSNDNNLEFAK